RCGNCSIACLESAQIGRFERWHPVLLFAGDVQRFSAGSDDAQVWTGIEQAVDEAGTRVDKVLAIIEDEQARLRCEQRRNRGYVWRRTGPVQTERRHDYVWHQLGIRHRGQLDHPGPVWKV